MNVLFLTLINIDSIDEYGIYQDLMREFIKANHYVYIVSPSERHLNENTRLIKRENYSILKVKIGNTQKTNLIEKGISILLIEKQIKKAVTKYFSDVKFDLIIYSTPPITLVNAITAIKKRDSAKSYLMLKDIFPQNAVDLEMMSNNGYIYKYFRRKEKKLYLISDLIGCMSQANVDYIITHNSYLEEDKIHVLPNAIEVNSTNVKYSKQVLRAEHGIPLNKKVFIYGGNLGKPQDIPFIIECLKANQDNEDTYFIICGTGTEYSKIEKYANQYEPQNVKIINGLTSAEYNRLIQACDVGLIFLDHRFTIPNFPSRLLSYMQNNMPVIACTDCNTDIKKVIEEGNFGWWCESKDVQEFTNLVNKVCLLDITEKGKNAMKYLIENFSVSESYKRIMEKINENSSE